MLSYDFHEIVVALSRGLILDVGCGTGEIMHELSRFRKRTIGVDISLSYLKEAKIKGLSCIQGDAHFLPFRENVFDTVIALDVIEHLEDPLRFLKECNRVLKRRGIIFIHTPNKWMTEIRRCLTKWPGWHPEHIHEFIPYELSGYLTRAGFVNMKVLMAEPPLFLLNFILSRRKKVFFKNSKKLKSSYYLCLTRALIKFIRKFPILSQGYLMKATKP